MSSCYSTEGINSESSFDFANIIIVDESVSVGTFYKFEEILDEFTDNETMNICYRNNYNNLYEGRYGNKMEVPEDQIIDLEPLCSNVQEAIINDFYLSVKDNPSYNDPYLDFSKSKIRILVYCGFFEGYFLIRFEENLMVPAELGVYEYGGYIFVFPTHHNKILAWKPNLE